MFLSAGGTIVSSVIVVVPTVPSVDGGQGVEQCSSAAQIHGPALGGEAGPRREAAHHRDRGRWRRDGWGAA